ncbi:MAG: hypothetical protein N2037_04740 [Acidimicrobiales bacterium]|nr:hypothetical protein [Acidimicrobiales bacterium]
MTQIDSSEERRTRSIVATRGLRLRTALLLCVIALAVSSVGMFRLSSDLDSTARSPETSVSNPGTQSAPAPTRTPESSTLLGDEVADAPLPVPESGQRSNEALLARDANGNFLPTGAGSDAYPRYLGGDFDDTTPNTVASFGVDENGCDANYAGACVPPLPARTTCEELGAVNIEVVNGDPQGLDPDGDGFACGDTAIVRTDYGENTQEPRD